MKIGIITAMSSEQKQVTQLLENKKEYTEGPFQYTEGSIRNNTIILMKCGIGKVNAAAGTVELIRTFQPTVSSDRCSRRYRQLPENNGCCGEPTNCIS